MASKRPRSDSPEASFCRPCRKVTEPDPPPPVPSEDSIFSVQTDVSESTRAANLTAMLERIDRYTTSAERPHDEILQASLRNFLEMLPPDGGAELLKDLDSKPGDEGLYEVFSNLYTGLRSRMMSRSKPPSITPSPNPKRGDHAEALSAKMDKPISRDRKFKTALLARDGYKCAVTGHFDRGRYEELGLDSPDLNPTNTQGAHIIPFSYGFWNSSQGLPPDMATAWEILYRCFPALRRLRFNWEDINNLENGITMAEWIHSMFRTFRLAFKATEVPDQYDVETFGPIGNVYRNMIHDRITFTNHDSAKDHKLPSPIILECHYILAKILNASGMVEAFDHDFDIWEAVKESVHSLREDGKTDIGSILGLSFLCDDIAR
ncbi:uncharacterized protein PGRI_063720 [Penicillium griseofulvum]|uniref:HNH nuclease domain-containing protein n=1 Tax=Penicillium patulum TaxID=5078 RepID=A0A135LPB5_PENPA|nr:uncharacterized protein PGRI_063720 [Penicillium griseofulvum]KXG50800.1 hypothetical protein PGRI_063720 [Penicillium griseofulvum]